MTRPQLINIVAHIAGWLLFFSLLVGFLFNSNSEKDIVAQLFSPSFLLFYFIYLFLFYFNAYVLIPQFYLQRRYLLYFLCILLLLAAVYYLQPFDRLMNIFRPHAGPSMQDMDHPGPPRFDHGGGFRPEGPGRHSQQKTDIISIILFVAAWSLSTALCIIKQWRMTEQRATKAETDKANAELSFLKAQVNPHFLFNTLNNIYSLAVTNNENTAPSIMKLSNIMRYVTDDVREDYVSLENEMQCMSDYIDLQRMRLGKKMNVDLDITGDISTKKIAPLILMTFIENVFKYGVSNHEPAAITIKLAVTDHTIDFFCVNKLFATERNAERTGIGIENTRQRLQHLYPGKHVLKIDRENGFYSVHLKLEV